MKKKVNFIPATMERKIAKDIFWRPIKSWHSGSYGGEGREEIPGTTDGSGCVKKIDGIPMTHVPYTVTHRLYWNKETEKSISAFLSYPDAMGVSDGEYFWEIMPSDDNDIERFFGDDAEEEMEKKIIKLLRKKRKK